MKTLAEIIARLAAIDEEVRGATDADVVEKLAQEKTDLLARKAELEELETRKQAALGLQGGAAPKLGVTTNPTEQRTAEPEDKFATL